MNSPTPDRWKVSSAVMQVRLPAALIVMLCLWHAFNTYRLRMKLSDIGPFQTVLCASDD